MKIDELKAWAGEHSEHCQKYFYGRCACDVPMKQKLVAFVESFRNWRSYASVENFQILRKAENDLEDA